jgi:hypothetical protein
MNNTTCFQDSNPSSKPSMDINEMDVLEPCIMKKCGIMSTARSPLTFEAKMTIKKQFDALKIIFTINAFFRFKRLL